MNRLPLLPFAALLLAACTGTEEGTLPVRLAVLTDGGATLRAVTTRGTGVQPVPVPDDPDPISVNGGVALGTLPGGKRFALTLTGGIESRAVNLADPQPFAAPFDVPGFSPPCLKTTVLNAQRDRLLTLSECENGRQQLALYRTDGTLVWRALPPVAYVPTDPDAPPTRLALTRTNNVDIAIVARPALGGGSEVLRVASETGREVADVSDPVPTPAIRDLAPASSGVIYAATDAGIQPLTETGVPNAQAALAAFGTGRVDRIWTSVGSGVGGSLIAAWRDTALSGGGSEPLRLWDAAGGRTSAVTVVNVAELRDVTFAPDGNLYALTRTALTSYDVLFGLSQGNWRATTLLYNLSGGQAVTWLVP
ncbi:hypothetical protein [Deinococcus sp. YIM 77859]|uniref:hypothetical protein n=1 Tax=Deinococcus sp. YIM 77859 TaxID=1540221 RepID=UPI0005530145|nr:hypothetical protein [Deinococcus sp. YIM 77859]